MSVAEPKRDESSTRPVWGWAFVTAMADVKLPGLKAHALFWPVTVLGIVLDLWTKSAVFAWLEQPDAKFPLIDGLLNLVTALNTGAAFGIATGQRYLLIAVSVVALIVILAVFLFGGSWQKLVHITLGLFAAGVCGNLYDRIFNDGLVRDFIDVVIWPGKHWPAFNLADTMLCTAVGLLLVSSLFTGMSCQKHAQQRK